MIVSVMAAILAGAALARFYNVLILIPAFALILAVVVGMEFYLNVGLIRAALEFALLIASLQIGYVALPISYVVMAPFQQTRKRFGKSSAASPRVLAARQR